MPEGAAAYAAAHTPAASAASSTMRRTASGRSSWLRCPVSGTETKRTFGIVAAARYT